MRVDDVVDRAELPASMYLRCGGRNRRDAARRCGHRFGRVELLETGCVGCDEWFLVGLLRGVQHPGAPARVRPRSVRRGGEDPGFRLYGESLEFTCPKCGARPRCGPFSLAARFVSAARASLATIYV